MKRTTIILVFALLALSLWPLVAYEGGSQMAASSVTFRDVRNTDWFSKTVIKLVEMGGITGYPDGTFRPNTTITTGEFIKTVVAAIDGKEENATYEHWAMNYIRKAEAMGYIDKDEYIGDDLNKKINRVQMAKIIVRAAERQGEKFTGNPGDYIPQIKDYNTIPILYRDFVLKAYTKGILLGYPDGEFKGDRGLTRAEAATAIVRIFQEDMRMVAPPVEEEVKITIPEPVFRTNVMPYGVQIHLVNAPEFPENKREMMVKAEIISHPEFNYSEVKGLFENRVLKYNHNRWRQFSALSQYGEALVIEAIIDNSAPNLLVPNKSIKRGEKIIYKISFKYGLEGEVIDYMLEFQFDREEGN